VHAKEEKKKKGKVVDREAEIRRLIIIIINVN
jgi:hypothetical protein